MSDTGCIRLRMFHTRVLCKGRCSNSFVLASICAGTPLTLCILFLSAQMKTFYEHRVYFLKKIRIRWGHIQEMQETLSGIFVLSGEMKSKKRTVLKNVAGVRRTILETAGWQKRRFYPYLKWRPFFVSWKNLKTFCEKHSKKDVFCGT